MASIASSANWPLSTKVSAPAISSPLPKLRHRGMRAGTAGERDLLATRRDLLVRRLADRDALIAGVGVELPRVAMLETEYLHAITEAEIHWIDGVLAGLRDRAITWDQREMRETVERLDR